MYCHAFVAVIVMCLFYSYLSDVFVFLFLAVCTISATCNQIIIDSGRIPLDFYWPEWAYCCLHVSCILRPPKVYYVIWVFSIWERIIGFYVIITHCKQAWIHFNSIAHIIWNVKTSENSSKLIFDAIALE